MASKLRGGTLAIALLVAATLAVPLPAQAAPDPPPDDLWRPSDTPDEATYVHLEADDGASVVPAGTHDYDPTDALIEVSVDGHVIFVETNGDEHWRAYFAGPTDDGRPEAGYYPDATGYPFHDPEVGGLSWFGEGRGCNEVWGWFVIDHIVYDGAGDIAQLRMRFEHRCHEPDEPPLHGEIVYDAAQAAPRPENPRPVPAGLWAPDPATVPDDGTYVHLERESGSGAPLEVYDYDLSNALITVVEKDTGWREFVVDGDEWWTGRFVPPLTMDRLEPGYYAELQKTAGHNPVKGGLRWAGHAPSCIDHDAWVVVDEVSYTSAGVLATLTMRFEIVCVERPDQVLHGIVGYDSGADPPPPDNPQPIPDGLWEPDPDDVPADAATFVYLESTPGDYIVQGGTYSYRTSNAVIEQTGADVVHVEIEGYERWRGSFTGPDAQTQLEPGYYSDLNGYPGHNPTRGGLNWSGESRACQGTGWFAVDHIAHGGSGVYELRLRFEQRCEPDGPPLRGLIVYDRYAPIEPSPNPRPIPGDLWQPDPELLPDADTFAYFEMTDGDDTLAWYYDYESTDTFDTTVMRDEWIDVSIRTLDGSIDGDILGPADSGELQPGLYAELENYNPRMGKLYWSGTGTCNDVDSWFAVDEVTWEDGELLRLRVRFEQDCEGDELPAIRGVFVYAGPDTTEAPPPDTVITSGPPELTTSTSATLTFTSDPAGAEFACSLEFSPWLACTSPLELTDLGDGDYFFRVRAVDEGGNFDQTNAFHRWTVDTTPPNTLVEGPSGTITRDEVTYSFSASEPVSGFTCSLDGGAWTPCTSPTTYSGLEDGEHVFRVRAHDHAGHIDPTPARRVVTVVTAGDQDEPTTGDGTDDRSSPGDAAEDDASSPGDAADDEGSSTGGSDAEVAPGSGGTVRVLGGTAAVSDEVIAAVAGLTGDTPQRLEGADRYTTAAAVVAEAFPDPVETVYLATGRDFPDALAGAAAAGHLGAPVLLTDPLALPDATAEQLTRLRPAVITVLGGESAVSDQVVAEVGTLTGVRPQRLAGRDRYGTAAATIAHAFPREVDTVYLATGRGFADALAGAAAAATFGAPVLLTDPDRLPEATADEFARLRPRVVKVLGGESAVSAAVVAEVAAVTGVAPVRLAGADRYATAAATTADAFAGSAAVVYLATGTAFPDALAGAAAAAARGAPVLLTGTATLPEPTAAELERLLR